MYAIVDIAGQQFKVEKQQKLFVHRLDAEEGTKVDFDKVLLVDDDGKIKIGSPVVENTIVSAKVVGHLKSDKVKVFRKKRRKGFKVLNGHRQYMTELVIEDIKEGKVEKKAAPKAQVEEKPVEKKVAVAPTKEAVAKKEAPAKKAAAPKKETAAKKTVAPKAKTAEGDDAKKESKE